MGTKPQLCVIRGLPGSGKTALAKLMMNQWGYDHLEADQFFIDDDRVFRFKPELLPKAHEWCLKCTEISLLARHDVVVANTFVKRSQIAPYIALAEKLGAGYQEIVCEGTFGSIHGVPRETIARMASEWEW